MDTSTTAFMGCLIAYSGDWDHGCALVEFAMQLNPQHPGWYWLPNSYRAYRQRDYRRALDFALRVNMAGYFFAHAVTAAVCGQLGMRQAAEKALQELLAIRPDFATAARAEFGKWFAPDMVEHLLEGLRKAGLEIADEPSSPVAKPATRA